MRVLRVIARLNMGGPAHHVGLLSAKLDPERYETLLLHGEVGPGEDSLEPRCGLEALRWPRVPGLSPELRPHDDARALGALVRSIRRLRPDIVHTHTAKAGMLGRLAAVLAGGRRPIIVHTYHGHVLEGYFGPLATPLYRGLERRLASVSDAPRRRELSHRGRSGAPGGRPTARSSASSRSVSTWSPFLAAAPAPARAFRRRPASATARFSLTFVGRLVRDQAGRRSAARRRPCARARERPSRLAIVGDGELSARARAPRRRARHRRTRALRRLPGATWCRSPRPPTSRC